MLGFGPNSLGLRRQPLLVVCLQPGQLCLEGELGLLLSARQDLALGFFADLFRARLGVSEQRGLGFFGLLTSERQLCGESLFALPAELLELFFERLPTLCLGGRFGRSQGSLTLFLGLRFDGGQFVCSSVLGFDPDALDLLG